MKLLTMLLVVFLCALPVFAAQEANIRESARDISLWTDDGLSLALDRTTGQLANLTVDGLPMPMTMTPVVRFEEALLDPNAPDLIGDGSFAGGPGAWELPKGALEEAPDAQGRRWASLTGSTGRIAKRVVILNQTEPQPVVVTGLCRAEMHTEASGWMNSNLALNIVGYYADGTRMPEQSAYFGQYDHGPQFSRKVLCPDKPLQRVEVFAVGPGGACKAWFTDIRLQAARYRIASPATDCERIDARITQDFNLPDAGLRGLLTYQPMARCIELRGHFESTLKADRAISAYVAFPLDAVGGVWYDDFRRQRRIEPGQLYRNAKWYGAGRDGFDGRYPLACVQTRSGATLCLAIGPDEPRVFQVEYDASRKELRLRFDLGLSPDAGRWANRGAFTAYLFRADARDGFRGVTETYHHIFDWAFLTKRVEREGLWMAFNTPQAVTGGCEDFHVQFVEGVHNVGWETQKGMYSLRYVEPWIAHQQSPPGIPFEETRGPVDPQGAVAVATRMAQNRSAENAPDERARYAAYLGSFIEDQWGQPQGYFFRSPQGRNENMMIVDPDPALPPPEGAHFASGALDNEGVREALRLWKQWTIPGWILYRVSERPSGEIDTEQKASGRQSLRFDPSRAKNYFEQYVRGVSQTVYVSGEPAGAFEFAFSARGEDIPTAGTGLKWSVEFQYEDETVETHSFGLEGLGPAWQRFTRTVTPKRRPFAITVLLVNAPWSPDPTRLWIDDVSLTVRGRAGNLLTNGGFEQASLAVGRVAGVYMDTMECYTNNLNYRRTHWPYAQEPLTFDCGRSLALQQQFSHVTYGRWMAEWMQREGRIVFGNCAPGTCFAAPYLDAMGGEEDWMPGGKWSPKADEDFCFTRFMCRAKPFCLLQYADLDRDHVERYVKRCLFYGVFPSNQSSSRVSGKWYWNNPVAAARDRPTYAKYMPALLEIAKAGWQPLTLAASDGVDVWVERFGEGRTVYLTVLNASDRPRSTNISLDPRLGFGAGCKATDILAAMPLSLRNAGDRPTFDLRLAPEDVRVVRLTR